MPTLITNNLTKIYKTRGTDVNAINDVSLSVETGEFVTIMGASGSGKSTLLHLVAGLTTPTRGNVTLNDVDLFSLNDSERTKFRLRHIGIVFQSFNLIPTLTARENILLPSQIDGRKISEDEFGKLLDTLELSPRRNHRPDSLSGGEQQRVAIARALMMSPALILADEPTGNLDSVNSENICKALRQLCDNDKRTIILVTHDKTVADWGDRSVTLRDGQIARER